MLVPGTYPRIQFRAAVCALPHTNPLPHLWLCVRRSASQVAPAVLAVHTYLLHLCTGLGGGLGRLLAEPILKAMQESTEAGKNLSEARRVLEMVVPLAYRPPLKVSHSVTALPSACPPPPPPAAGMLSRRHASSTSAACRAGGMFRVLPTSMLSLVSCMKRQHGAAPCA